MGRRTRQIVAFVLGNRSAETCRRFWEALPEAYRAGLRYRDGGLAYEAVGPAGRHRRVEKGSGGWSPLERWHHTMRQRLGRDALQT
jgi:insertion element IS1 protein InsB